MSSRRSRAREAVLQVLYQHDLNPDLADDIVLDQLRERLVALRESVPSHQQLMDQAREHLQARDRRGE